VTFRAFPSSKTRYFTLPVSVISTLEFAGSLLARMRVALTFLGFFLGFKLI
jgi:hypothetical protein